MRAALGSYHEERGGASLIVDAETHRTTVTEIELDQMAVKVFSAHTLHADHFAPSTEGAFIRSLVAQPRSEFGCLYDCALSRRNSVILGSSCASITSNLELMRAYWRTAVIRQRRPRGARDSAALGRARTLTF
jgi:hypothetical protein